MLQGDSWLIRRRYREFRELHDHLKLKYPDILPQIPGKRLWGNSDPDFVKERQEGLQRYMDNLLDMEPECSTKFFRLFLEIRDAPKDSRRPSDGSSHRSTPITAPTLHINHPPTPTIQDKKLIFQEVQDALFDLSATPTLLEPAEVDQRHAKYSELFNRYVASARFKAYSAPAPISPVSALNQKFDVPEGVLVNLK